MPFQIIPAGSADVAEITALVNSAYRGDSARRGWTHEAELLGGTRTDEADIKNILNAPGYSILKYVKNGRVMGCVELKLEVDRLYLGMLTVNPDLQGKGIGKALMKAAEDYAINKRCGTVFMTVISVRGELIAWYNRHGYHATGERRPFDFTDPRFGKPKQQLEFLVLEKKLE